MSSSAAVVRQVVWRLRYDLLAVPVVAAAMAVLMDAVPIEAAAAPVVPLLGIVVSIFIGLRNRNAYNRWWEARTLWAGVVSNGRALDYALNAYDDGSPEMATVLDRMRRREVRHAWTLAAELHGTPVAAWTTDLTPEDPVDATSGDLLARQTADVGELSRAGLIDRQARRVLVTINTAQVNAVAGLERVRHQTIPRYYDLFTRGLAWFFAVMVCTMLGGGNHDNAVGIVLGVMIMALFVVAERLGHLLERPMSDDSLGLPLDRFCTELSADLLGSVRSPASGQG